MKCAAGNPFQIRSYGLIGLTVLLINTHLLALSWHDESYFDKGWKYGKGPLGYGASDISTLLTPYQSTYSFRCLFYLPAYSDEPIEALELTVECEDGLIVFVHSTETGRSPSLDPGDIPYHEPARFYDEDGVQIFDASWLLTSCQNSLRESYRSIVVDVHRVNQYSASFRFHARITGICAGKTVELTGDSTYWRYHDFTEAPVAESAKPIGMLIRPVAGMPVFPDSDFVFEAALHPDFVSESHFFAVSSHASYALIVNNINQKTPWMKGYDLAFPSEPSPGTYDLVCMGDGCVLDRSFNSISVLPGAAEDLTIAHITDSHIPFRGNYALENTDKLLRTIDTIANLGVDLVIHTGDAYNEGNHHDQAELFSLILEKTRLPVVYMPGNHELGEWCGTGTSRTNFWEFFGWPELNPEFSEHWSPITRDFTIRSGAFVFFIMESWINYTDYWKPYYRTTSFLPDQLTWLRQSAAAQDPDAIKIACYHEDYDDDLWSVLPELGISLTLSGHTHESTEESHDGTLFLKTDATYGSSRSIRRLVYENGGLIEYPVLMRDCLAIDGIRELEPFNYFKNLTVINNESFRIPGCRLSVFMPAGTDYDSEGAQMLGQWPCDTGRLICLKYDIDAFESKEISVHPVPFIPKMNLWLKTNRSFIEPGDHLEVTGVLDCSSSDFELHAFVAMLAGDCWFFWPDWALTPSPIVIEPETDLEVEFPVIDVKYWPSLDGPPCFFELYGLLTDSTESRQVSDLSHLVIYYAGCSTAYFTDSDSQADFDSQYDD